MANVYRQKGSPYPVGRAKKPLKESPPRVRFLKDRHEFAKLLAEMPARDHVLVTVAVETGMRRGELLALEWADVDLDRREIYIPDSKNYDPRVVPLSRDCVDALSAHPRHLKSPLVFRDDAGAALSTSTLSHRFRLAARRAGIEDFRFHDLRHTFGSWKVQAGHDLYRVGKMLGHRTLAQTQRYAHLRPTDLRDLVE